MKTDNSHLYILMSLFFCLFVCFSLSQISRSHNRHLFSNLCGSSSQLFACLVLKMLKEFEVEKPFPFIRFQLIFSLNKWYLFKNCWVNWYENVDQNAFWEFSKKFSKTRLIVKFNFVCKSHHTRMFVNNSHSVDNKNLFWLYSAYKK